jgi:hypothetical protein
MDNGKPRSVSQSISKGSFMPEPKFMQVHQQSNIFYISFIIFNISNFVTPTNVLHWHGNLDFAEKNVHETHEEQSTSGSHSKQCTFKRLGSIRLTQNNEVSNACYTGLLMDFS